jgi:hypothetical protein
MTVPIVIPAQAGTQSYRTDLALGSRLRGNDNGGRFLVNPTAPTVVFGSVAPRNDRDDTVA